jgi:hypothetical protein
MAGKAGFLSIRVFGDSEAAEAFHERMRMWPRVRDDLASKSSYLVERELKLTYSEGPLYARSNTLERSVGRILKSGSGGVQAGAGTKRFYALVHETGMVIFGRPVMHWQEDGKWIHAKMVTIPARKPGQRAHQNAEPKVRKLWHRTVRRFVN